MQDKLDLDCYQRKEPNEEHFTLLARDKSAPALIRLWAAIRAGDTTKATGEFAKLVELSNTHYKYDPTDYDQIDSALAKATTMDEQQKRKR